MRAENAQTKSPAAEGERRRAYDQTAVRLREEGSAGGIRWGIRNQQRPPFGRALLIWHIVRELGFFLGLAATYSPTS